MKVRNFWELMGAQWDKGNFVCVGLDSDLEKIPEAAQVSAADDPYCFLGLDAEETIFQFNKEIVEATYDLVCVYKPNTAFYEAHGDAGWRALRDTIAYINQTAPEVPVILDAKRADIGNTNVGYARMAFDYLKADAITVNPYFGREALEPFLKRKDKGVFVLCRTSNPGAGEFQDIDMTVHLGEGEFLREKKKSWHISGDGYHARVYEHVAYRVSQAWNKNGNCALVVGATSPYELCKIRQIVGDMPILIPGVGAQGGDVEKTVAAGKDSRGRGMIINSARAIIFASSGYDFAQAARRETEKLRDLVNQCRLALPKPR